MVALTMSPDYQKELINQMRQLQSIKNQKQSKLESFKKEILTLRHFNFSYKKIIRWLNDTYQIKVSLSKIHYMTTVIWKNDPFLESVKELPML